MGTSLKKAGSRERKPVGNRWNLQVLVQYFAVADEANAVLNES